MALRSGDRLGPYEIVSPLGAGGMGEVYRARDPRLGRDVALKILPPESSEPDRVRRFEQEARAVAALRHPHILAVHDVGSHEGQPYIVLELLEGETLRQRLSHGPSAGQQGRRAGRPDLPGSRRRARTRGRPPRPEAREPVPRARQRGEDPRLRPGQAARGLCSQEATSSRRRRPRTGASGWAPRATSRRSSSGERGRPLARTSSPSGPCSTRCWPASARSRDRAGRTRSPRSSAGTRRRWKGPANRSRRRSSASCGAALRRTRRTVSRVRETWPSRSRRCRRLPGGSRKPRCTAPRRFRWLRPVLLAVLAAIASGAVGLWYGKRTATRPLPTFTFLTLGARRPVRRAVHAGRPDGRLQRRLGGQPARRLLHPCREPGAPPVRVPPGRRAVRVAERRACSSCGAARATWAGPSSARWPASPSSAACPATSSRTWPRPTGPRTAASARCAASARRCRSSGPSAPSSTARPGSSTSTSSGSLLEEIEAVFVEVHAERIGPAARATAAVACERSRRGGELMAVAWSPGGRELWYVEDRVLHAVDLSGRHRAIHSLGSERLPVRRLGRGTRAA